MPLVCQLMSPIRQTVADEPFFLIRSLAENYEAGRSTGRHTHGWGQLIYCSQGVMTVWTETGSWVAPPQWAIWVPAAVAHDIRFAGSSALRTVYLRGDLASGLPADCSAMTVSPLMRELILRAMDLRMLDERQPMHQAMASLIVAELMRHDAPPFELPSPASPATQAAAEIMQAQDVPLPGAATLARAVGLSCRTLERRFQAETGLSVAAWGRQARLLQGLRGLAAGEPVKRVAQAAGYRSPSAFVAAFKAAFGKTPGRYFWEASGPTAWP